MDLRLFFLIGQGVSVLLRKHLFESVKLTSYAFSVEDARLFPGLVISEGSLSDGLVVTENIPGVLADVKRWELLGTITNGTLHTKVWRGIGPHPNYVLPCDFAMSYGDTIPAPAEPPAGYVKGLKAIHKSCLERATYTNPRKLQSTTGLISIWDISPTDGLPPFWRAGLYGRDPDTDGFMLKKEVIG
jgi:hypothetical protein